MPNCKAYPCRHDLLAIDIKFYPETDFSIEFVFQSWTKIESKVIFKSTLEHSISLMDIRVSSKVSDILDTPSGMFWVRE